MGGKVRLTWLEMLGLQGYVFCATSAVVNCPLLLPQITSAIVALAGFFELMGLARERSRS